MAVSERLVNHRDAPMGPGGTLAAQAPKGSLTLSHGTTEGCHVAPSVSGMEVSGRDEGWVWTEVKA